MKLSHLSPALFLVVFGLGFVLFLGVCVLLFNDPSRGKSEC